MEHAERLVTVDGRLIADIGKGRIEDLRTITVVAVCTPKVLGQMKPYIEGWQEEKEDWE